MSSLFQSEAVPESRTVREKRKPMSKSLQQRIANVRERALTSYFAPDDSPLCSEFWISDEQTVWLDLDPIAQELTLSRDEHQPEIDDEQAITAACEYLDGLYEQACDASVTACTFLNRLCDESCDAQANNDELVRDALTMLRVEEFECNRVPVFAVAVTSRHDVHVTMSVRFDEWESLGDLNH